jgi:predicted nuclease with TOPRIM domain
MNKLMASLFLMAIALSASLLTAGYIYWDSLENLEKSESKHKQLLLEFAALSSQYSSLQTLYDALTSDYDGLNRTFLNLNSTYFELSASFTTLNLQHFSLEESYSKLSENFTELETQLVSLNQSFNELVDNYDVLNQSYSTLQIQYNQLNTLYSELQANYATLNTTYNTLYEEHQALVKLLNEPLDDVVIPAWDEVKEWLASDKTDEIPYDSEKFLCGDFSIEHHHGNYGHAFVSIFTTEGIVYIEPQSDFTWYLYYEGDPDTHVEFEDWEFIDFEDDWFGHIFVQYYNRMGMYVCPNEVATQEIKVASNL